MTTIAVHLIVDDPEAAATWYATALGAQETSRIVLPGGTVLTIERLAARHRRGRRRFRARAGRLRGRPYGPDP
jgi:hypothetical protein